MIWMNLRLWTALGFFAVSLGGPTLAVAEDASPTTKSDQQNAVFGLTKMHQVKLEISAKDYAAMEPKGNGFPFGFGGPGPGGAAPGGTAPGAPGPNRPGPGGPGAVPPGGFVPLPSLSFDYVHAKVQIDDKRFDDVGARYKGNGTFMMSSRTAKRSFKVDLDRFTDDVDFQGIRKFNFHCNVSDPTKAREVLAYSVFRAAGIPASRTAFAEVSLTVPGRYESELLGVYTVVEQVDKAFLATHFQSAAGLLLKPQGLKGIQYLGDDPAAYKQLYDGKTDADAKLWQRLIEFAKCVNQPDASKFQKEIGNFIDVDQFLRFLAVNTLLANYDSFMGMGHNYYLYLVPKTNKFVFFPWDLDLAFGSHPMLGPMEQQIDLSIDHPQMGEINLIDRLLANPEFKQAFRAQIRRLSETVFTEESLGQQIEAIETAIKESIEKEKVAVANRREGGGFGFGPPGGGGPFGGTPMGLRDFVRKRSDAVESQLSGKSPGTIPRPPFGPGGPGGPGGGRPGGMLARLLLSAADTNKDGKLSTGEIENVAALLKKRDTNDDGLLDEKELEAAINIALPAPQFGPPGGGNRGPMNPPKSP